jgi:hypothetical protein
MTDEELLHAAANVLPSEWGIDPPASSDNPWIADDALYYQLRFTGNAHESGNLILRILELIEDRLGLSAMLVFRENTIHLCAPGAKPMIWNTCKGQTIQHAVLEALLWASKQEGWSK